MNQEQYDTQVKTDSEFLNECVNKLHTIKWLFLIGALITTGYSIYSISDYWYCYWVCNNPTCGPAMRWGVMLMVVAVPVLIACFICINILIGDNKYARFKMKRRSFDRD